MLCLQIIHHTGCGMLLFTDDDLIAKVKEDTGADLSGACVGVPPASCVIVTSLTGQHFHPFSDIEQSVRDDIAYVKAHPAVPDDIPVFGFVYDVTNGKLTRVQE